MSRILATSGRRDRSIVTGSWKIGAALALGLAGQTTLAQEHKPRFNLKASESIFPIIHGTTDLADGTSLFVNVRKPWLTDAQQRLARGLSACDGPCVAAMGPKRTIGMTVEVQRKAFFAGPFSFNGEPFVGGPYTVELSHSVGDLTTATPDQLRLLKNGPIYSATIHMGPRQKAQNPIIPPPAKPYVPKWTRVEADNGAEYQVDLNSVYQTTDGAADIVVYTVTGPQFDPRNMRRMFFTCRGYYRVLTDAGLSAPTYVPPRSVVGQIAAIACKGAKDTRF